MNNLRTYLKQVAEARPQDIMVIEREVNPRCELTAFVEKFEEQKKDPALYFKKVTGTRVPVILNLLASFERLSLAFGCKGRKETVEEFARRSERRMKPEVVPSGPVKELVLKGEDAKLSVLPQLVHNELDGGPYICSGATILRDPDTGSLNLGIYRSQIKPGNRLGLMINPANHGSHILNKYREAREPLEVAIALGLHPALILSAGGGQLPHIGGEFDLAGGLLQEPVKLVKGETIGLHYPHDSEIVIEGVVDDPTKVEDEGNFGEYPRYYSGRRNVPTIRVTAICMRRDAIFQDVAAAHDEHMIMGSLPRMATRLQLIRANAPNVQMINLPKSGTCVAHMYVSIKKRNDGEGMHAGLAALAAHPSVKLVVVVDEDIDVFDEEQVWWAVAYRFQADRNLVMVPNTLGAHLNPSAYGRVVTERGVMETRMILDATWPIKGFDKPPVARSPKEIYQKVSLEDCKNRIDGEILARLGGASEIRASA